MLRRVTAPRGAQGAGSGKAAGAAQGSAETGAPESTQVLRRVTAPREAAEPGEAARTAAAAPNTTGRAARTPRTPGPGANRAAQAAGAAAAGAAGLAGAAGQASQAGAAGAAAAGAAGAVAPGPRTGSSSRTAPGPRSATGAGRTVGRDSAGAAEPETGALAAADDGGPGAAEGKGKKAKRPKRTGWRRIIPTWRMVLGGFVVGVLLVIGLFVLGYSMVNIPPANAMAVKQSNVYLYADGSQMARDGDINRENVSLAQVSKDAQHAVLAAEDRDFYSESAIDPKAMLRAAWNTATGKGKQSGSTITQQYVKNYYLAQEQTVTRKAKEFFISIKLDRNKSKDEILEGYLNTSFFGRNAYGIQAAAQAYYGVDAKDLDPARAAYLAALVNAPSEYDVVAHPENKSAAVARWNYVLDGMVKKGWLSESKRAGMKFPMPKEQTVSTGLSGQRGYLVRAVNDYLTKNNIVDTDQLEAGGYRITTTIQKTRQDAFVKAVDDQLISKLDKKNNKVDNYVRAGGASVDPKTGKVVAMYGGIDYVKQYTNGATRGDFQVGSTFKPFVFTSAVQNGSTTQDGRTITPNTTYDGTNERPVQGWSGSGYAPENEDQKSYGQIGVTKATDLSVNAVYAQMAVDVGPSKVKQTAIDLGIPSGTPDLQPYPSIALGTATASVLDMAEGYATLANHGKHGTYTMIEKITKDGTEEVKLPDDQVKQAVSREAADTTTSILQSVVDNGTATAAQAADRPAAGKTGTAENDTAAWFAGYTPDLATVVSVMGQDPVTAKHVGLYGALGQARMNGGGPPTEIWAQYTRDALEGKPASDFDLQLQQGADEPQPPSATGPARPGTTGGQNTGGATASPTGGGATQSPAGGATGTPTDGGATTGTGPGTTGGTTTTTGGTTATGGGATGGGTTTGTGTTGGVTDGGAATGGDAATGGAADGGGGTTGTAAGDGGGPLT
ncbi:penicillin-binding protein [Streptomyces yokosukanensis]|uniref:Penicillin-binding protein n=1 Tax=Streptomyces yokosukanensis TaxID=67386 RepID=A0A101NY90_9ACTN|nr:transglycosylase domain-containing protein [Streptomyces yokosukanensis]KUN01547.1 penicillin-binding protein [Streptomyces yokosukanensis]